MASKFASSRHFLLCPVCKKTQPSLSVHLARVCMKRSSKEAIQEVMEKEKKNSLELLQWGRVFSYRHLREIVYDTNIFDRLVQELERRHMVVTDMPSPAVPAQTSSVPVVAGAAAQGPESSASQQSEDIVVSDSSGETFQVTREVQWPQTSRQMMQEKGLYRKHSLDHPLLKGFATYLEKDLLNENFKQEVENVSRFMFFVNPGEPSLEFVREREKTKLFFRELSEAGLSRQTQVNYMKSLKRFLKYHTVTTDLRRDNIALWNEAKHFVEYLSSLQQSSAKLVSKEIIQRR
ncbi:uncharacterized protein LOC125729431 isoform X2 [Brienomyrus brachyistius]|uniref:uncharacterized protein LOC125705820 n=2 Tax=Brienomyrus brachyistius TaxID=42636 RepID=UPI0020B213E2|nr:uncharacterized protein LOC125705818 isoform X1 [Brienomyrus brachyistius]XP_048828060.1 uncharacterized protein LOC125705818 isoform X1 [Brienomyrus brachyistius]XP_048828061.1 uncharacterized protein LOC125705818 isoform X1 [Brienomyrus brachyistius]XP_048828062.1 uncharacterized protein LOC125705818 isoform X1 [Brienomyrus brachyistius]XP_048828063.1 uncharacterized protein LOC125705818 isoform X1 [Brienomyrus brachyistius]XP_048828064.1 uncharacterized protein LOC125705818 isoform X1 [B